MRLEAYYLFLWGAAAFFITNLGPEKVGRLPKVHVNFKLSLQWETAELHK